MKTRTVQLGVKDRLVLLGLLPAEASFLEIKMIQGIKDDLVLSENEKVALGVIQHEKGVMWDQEAAKTCMKGITMSEATAALIAKTLTNMDKQGKLTVDHIGLYEMFVVTAKTDEA